MTPTEYVRYREPLRGQIGRWARLFAGGPAALLQGLTAMVAMLRAS